MSQPLRRRIEESFAFGLRAELAKLGVDSSVLPIFTGGTGDANNSPFFAVVACLEAHETSAQSRAYYMDIRVSLCCSIDLKTGAEHDAFYAAITQALAAMPRYAMGDDVLFCGWQIDRDESATEDQTYGDVFFIIGGVNDLAAGGS